MKPFLKWAGNKYRIVKAIQAVLPQGQRLVEPFVGSAAVFLNTQYQEYLLSDNNADLINLYQCLQKDGESFIRFCADFFQEKNNCSEKFYEYRQLFNEAKDKYLKAALFVYLNRHGFNGLCRYNASGKFNVPFGRYQKVYFPTDEMRAFHQKSQSAVFRQSNFVDLMAMTRSGDIVYCDPPYIPLSATANFTQYSALQFDKTHQIQLADLANDLSERGIKIVISNHDTELSRSLYCKASKIIHFEVQRLISCQGDKRNKAPELLACFG